MTLAQQGFLFVDLGQSHNPMGGCLFNLYVNKYILTVGIHYKTT